MSVRATPHESKGSEGTMVEKLTTADRGNPQRCGARFAEADRRNDFVRSGAAPRPL